MIAKSSTDVARAQGKKDVLPEYRMTLSFLFKSYSVESIGKSLCFVKGKIKITAPFFSVKELLNEEFDETYSGRLCQRSCFRYRWL
jgi:hypothetical protein